MPALLTLAALAGIGGAFVAGLYALHHLGEHLRRAEHHNTVGDLPRPVAAPQGWLSDEQRDAEQWLADTLGRDLGTLQHLHRVAEMRLHMATEKAIRRLLPPDEQAWYRIRTGEYTLAGAA